MSHRIGNLKVNFLSKNASEEEALNVLLELCDDDFNGVNGKDYVSPAALEAGYHSNAEYYFEEAKNDGLSNIDAIKEVLEIQYDRDSYYYDYAIEVLSRENGHFIATTYVPQ